MTGFKRVCVCVCVGAGVVYKCVSACVLPMHAEKMPAKLFICFGGGSNTFASIERFIDLFPINGQP